MTEGDAPTNDGRQFASPILDEHIARMSRLADAAGERGATVSEFSDLLGIPRGTVRNLLADPQLDRHAVFEVCGDLPPAKGRRGSGSKLYRSRGHHSGPSPRSRQAAEAEIPSRDDTAPDWREEDPSAGGADLGDPSVGVGPK